MVFIKGNCFLKETDFMKGNVKNYNKLTHWTKNWNQVKNMPVVLPSFTIKAQGIPELWSDIRTHKQILIIL